MRRYKFLIKQNIFDALNKLRAAFLAAKNGHEVEEIIKGILTSDERIKIGRRILIAKLLKEGETYDSIIEQLKVGKHTVAQTERSLENHPTCFELINKRVEKVEKEFGNKAYVKTGSSKLVFKKTEYTGFTRKDVQR